MTGPPKPDPIHRRALEAIGDLAVGTILLSAGVAGLALPVLPGWMLIGAGLVIISGRIPTLRSRVNRIMLSRPVAGLVERTASHRAGRQSLARILRARRIRRALLPDTRWAVVGRMVRCASQDPAGGRAADSRHVPADRQHDPAVH